MRHKNAEITTISTKPQVAKQKKNFCGEILKNDSKRHKSSNN